VVGVMSSQTTLLSTSTDFVHHVRTFRLSIVGVYKRKCKDLAQNDSLPELTKEEIDSIICECTKCNVNDILIPLIIRIIVEDVRREFIPKRTITPATP
jgi:hypothetical protein